MKKNSRDGQQPYYGLSRGEVKASYEAYGDNRLIERKGKSLFRRFLDNFGDPIIRILLIALALQVALTFGRVNWLETGGIVVAILLSTFVSTLSEYGSEKAFRRLQSEASGRTCRVRREGTVQTIPWDDLVRGDLVLLESGATLPADGRLLCGGVTVDQSALNGESAEAVKTPARVAYSENLSDPHLLFRGSHILSGEGIMEICRTGGDTLYGRIAHELQEEVRESPLKRRLSALATQISRIGYVAAALVSLAYLLNTFVLSNAFEISRILTDLKNPAILWPTLLHAFTLAITVIVVAVPEGLPMMITVVLSSNMKRMLKEQVLVKKMVGIETAGSMNILFSDKTGTLTSGAMTLDRVILGDGEVFRSASGLAEERRMAHLLSLSAHYNTASNLEKGKAVGGNATDRAILSHFSRLPRPSAQVRFHTPFDSRYRYEAVHLAAEGETLTFVKGAPELLLPSATRYLDREGREHPLSKEREEELRRQWREASEKGERVLAVCLSPRWVTDPTAFAGMTFLAFVCLKDKVRPDAAEAVRRLQEAGVQVVMMTGDNRETAAAIAAECGIWLPASGQMILTGAELAHMSDGEVTAYLPRLRVVARALPSDKSRLVRLAQAADLVVGMTGDGVNDAPSLKVADVGFAMGQGADIAKEAADIVLLDGKMESIAGTVLFGRTIFKSIRKFITFQLIMNLCAVGVSLLGQYVGIEAPVTIIQMLWVNIIMDTLGGLAFSGEAPLSYYMKEAPLRRGENILSPAMIHAIVFNGGYTLLLCGGFLVFPFARRAFGFTTDTLTYLTCFFVLFIFCGIFNCFAVRSERLNPLAALSRNPRFAVIMAFIVNVQMLMVYFGGEIFRTTPLPAVTLLRISGLAFTVVPFDFLRKILYKLRRPKKKKALPAPAIGHAGAA